jgi:hypothetical protein
MWESLVDLRENNPLFDASLDNPRPVPLPKPSRANPRASRRVIAAAVLGILLLGVIIYVKTDKGRIKFDVKDPNAVVKIDKEKVVVQPSNGGDPAEITASHDGREVRLKQGRTERSGEELTIKNGGSNSITVRSEPPIAPRPEEDQTKESRTSVAEAEIRPFNGTDFRGWNGFRDGHVAAPSDCVRIEGGELVWSVDFYGRIYTDKPYSNFSFKFDYSIPLNGRRRRANGHLRLAEVETYRIGQADYRIGEVGCSLLNGGQNEEQVNTGDIILWDFENRRKEVFVSPRMVDAGRPAETWNEVEIRCAGRSITFLLNGQEVNRFAGSRTIVCHPGFSTWLTDVRIRNIRIIPLGNKASAKDEVKDSLQPGTVWTGEQLRIVEGNSQTFRVIFTVRERNGDRFKARLEVATNIREINGTISNGRISWLARDVKVVKGHQGHDHTGTIQGEEISLVYSGIGVPEGAPVSGTVKLRLEK